MATVTAAEMWAGLGSLLGLCSGIEVLLEVGFFFSNHHSAFVILFYYLIFTVVYKVRRMNYYKTTDSSDIGISKASYGQNPPTAQAGMK